MLREPFRFDANLATASTLPSWFYLDAGVLDEENRKVFARTWQLVGHAGQVSEPGSFFSTAIADEPVLIARDREGTLRALSNVCRHRAGPVVWGAGKKPVLQCGYHGWTYGLDGKLLATPEFDGVECFPRDEVSLPKFRLEIWHELLFVNLDPAAPPLSAFFGNIESRMGQSDLSRFRPAARKVWEIHCNWKVYVDNYLEGYHIPIVHPGLFRELDYANYRTETQRYHSEQHSPVKKPDRIRLQKPEDEAKFFWVFPNLMLNVYPDNYSTNLIVPLGHQRTATIFEWYFENPDDPRTRQTIAETIAFSDEIQLEDIGVCEAVQRGLKSRTYTSGRYSVKRENGVHHFHGLLAEFLSA
jgi:choline monooxygenase